jgi:exosortase
MLWAYWPALAAMVRRWFQDPQYSHGFLVPLFALTLLWTRKRHAANMALRPSWWGVPILAASALLRLAGAFIYLDWLDAVSFLVSIAGVVVVLGGGTAWRWSWPALAFLLFMLPLPFQLEAALSHPLQRLATEASTYCLQTLGLPALAQGNVIVIDDLRIGVLEACNGLSMLLTFFALSTAAALVIRRPLPTKLTIVGSAVPIALILNVVRITVTGVLHQTVGSTIANAVFHDLAGWIMMPLALALLWLELLVLDRLFIWAETPGPVPVVLARSRGPKNLDPTCVEAV